MPRRLPVRLVVLSTLLPVALTETPRLALVEEARRELMSMVQKAQRCSGLHLYEETQAGRCDEGACSANRMEK